MERTKEVVNIAVSVGWLGEGVVLFLCNVYNSIFLERNFRIKTHVVAAII